MSEKAFCNDCEAELTKENTSSYGGFDSGNYGIASTFGQADKSWFTKCDSCFEADIDRHLENLHS